MKEGKLPPKMMGGVGGSAPTTTMIQCSPTISSTSSRGTSATQSSPVSSSTPSKQPSDEILSSLLRMNNFDSISSIKDESLDIDLSACVTISADPSGMIGGNSLSSSDFWKALDESAQTSQLDVSGGGGGSGSASGGSGVGCSRSPPSPSPSSNNSILNTSEKGDLGMVLKKEQTDFSGTFLKPSCGITFSPLKRCSKAPSTEQLHLMKDKSPTRIGKLEGPNQNNNTGGPPSLSPIIRINQFPKPTLDLPRLNGGTVTIKKESMTSSDQMAQPPPLAALDCTVNKNETAPTKVILEPMYKCLDCDVAFQGSQELANHNSHRMIYKCMECDREFDAEPSLKKHLKTHRPIDARKDAWKKCPDCGKCLKLGSMWMHRKIHTENKKYGCEICGQKFVQKINLTHHQRIHTSEKPYECSECQKRFQERSHLQRHQKYHAQTRSYRCEKCGKMYKTERCLKVHNLVHLEQRPFACTVCDKSFISNSKLKQHSNIHTGERPFKCNYCPRDFTNFPNWLKHTRRRHKVDHKTGEMLENIPSYCSKKSTRTPKEKKPNGTDTKNTTTTTPASQQNSASTTNLNGNNGIDLNKMDTTCDSGTNTATTLVASVVPLGTTAVTVASKTSVATTVANTVVVNNIGPPPLAKVPAKRKKKVQPVAINTTIKTEKDIVATTANFIVTAAQNSHIVNMSTSNGIGPPPLALVFSTKPMMVSGNMSPSTNATAASSSINNSPLMPTQQPNIKVEKVKRERKQSMPKQVQQVPPPIIIKKEFIEPKAELHAGHNDPHRTTQQQHEPPPQQQAKTPFPDLHCLSITSAEELIMEQALEMEECGLYKPTSAAATTVMPTFAETDNAISSESVANMHFKIKEEHHDMDLKTEDYDSIKKSISSLESSPFSSPASMEFATSQTSANDFNPTNTFYLPQFTITNNQIISNNSPTIAGSMKVEDSNNATTAATRQVRQLVATNINGVPELIQLTNSSGGNSRFVKSNMVSNVNNSSSTTGNDNTSSFINQLYLPLTVNAGPVLMKSHQALPSVDTLLFSHSKLALFNNRNLPKQATTAQHNLS
ncbi:serendipity locus protein H-1 [Musca vetustissima]|uniref:serendipity locus protein H-1 n=1 Tax=Musca vetustissima TaxID=27455 RepID=UPI002AB6E348|nr:serendipity locus protein H-1 [Musca vetustissima]